jgi:arginase
MIPASSPASILVELNPFLDERGRTAILMVDLAASLMGRRIMDRPTRSY